MVLSETRGLQLFGVIRGGTGSALRLAPAPGEHGLTADWILSLEPVGLKTTPATTGNLTLRSTALPGDELGGLRFQSFSVETLSFLPKVQTMAAILRARVKRASSGFRPWASLLV